MTRRQDIRATLQKTAALPADRPMGMPGSYYTDPDYFEWEKATVLRQSWHCLGRTDEIPAPGDYFTAQVLNEPLLVVRGDDDAIRVLANVCRHRGMPLAQGAGNTKRFVCSYHAWTYGRDGALLRAARMDNAGFDRDACRLNRFDTLVWRGFIYCNLGRNAVPFPGDNLALDALVAPYETEKFRLVHVEQGIWQTNWKCLVENFMEGYHLSVVHPETLHGYTPTGLSQKSASGSGFTSYCANYPEAAAQRGAGAAGLSASERHRSTLFCVFPTHLSSQAASLLVALYISPQSADRIAVKWTLSVYGDDLDDDTIAQRIALWQEVNREDREKLELMQISLGSQHATAGPLAAKDYEGTIVDFQHWLARQDKNATPRDLV